MAMEAGRSKVEGVCLQYRLVFVSIRISTPHAGTRYQVQYSVLVLDTVLVVSTLLVVDSKRVVES